MDKRILFVDDDVIFLTYLQKEMEKTYNDIHADFVHSAADAMEKIDRAEYNVIVSDYNMPGLNGAELFSIVREKYPDTVRILLSGSVDEVMKDVESYYPELKKY